MALGDNVLLQVAPDSQQHLEFVLMGHQAEAPDSCASVIDERRVVRGDGHTEAFAVWQEESIEHLIEKLAVIGVHFALSLERHECRFPIGPFD